MRSQPNRNYVSNDDIQTPPELAQRLVTHFQPTGRILEPCAGDGHFLRALRAHARTQSRRSLGEGGLALNSFRPSRVFWCEVKRNRDFFTWQQPVDWIITNPPWSQFRRFLQHALAHAEHIVFLVTINHLWTRARQHDIKSPALA